MNVNMCKYELTDYKEKSSLRSEPFSEIALYRKLYFITSIFNSVTARINPLLLLRFLVFQQVRERRRRRSTLSVQNGGVLVVAEVGLNCRGWKISPVLVSVVIGRRGMDGTETVMGRIYTAPYWRSEV